MPFDIAKFQIPAEAKGADPFDYRVLTPGHDGLRKLAWVLRHPEVWPQDHTWDFGTILRREPCGTVGCAMGVAQLMWGKQIWLYREAPFDMKRVDYDNIFTEGLIYGKGCAVTPLDVADAIDRYLAAQQEK